ncbi:hypothetical protein CkaCkLH20_08805 [Colletotrichum karsti]|uniref:Peptidase A1 domain-containing protein n=1 Tax=Colletotrichum karsti TaxID=1095194 RepID=A0A9P6I0R7_9PEZI|nr:uncharacterized protein CkaCkLH20_08805 [Colletotrichum karsti]KAF9873695.1 hypothetical protein CkaCkLH20_08805 [Colletotrichum karsti]
MNGLIFTALGAPDLPTVQSSTLHLLPTMGGASSRPPPPPRVAKTLTSATVWVQHLPPIISEDAQKAIHSAIQLRNRYLAGDETGSGPLAVASLVERFDTLIEEARETANIRDFVALAIESTILGLAIDSGPPSKGLLDVARAVNPFLNDHDVATELGEGSRSTSCLPTPFRQSDLAFIDEPEKDLLVLLHYCDAVNLKGSPDETVAQVSKMADKYGVIKDLDLRKELIPEIEIYIHWTIMYSVSNLSTFIPLAALSSASTTKIEFEKSIQMSRLLTICEMLIKDSRSDQRDITTMRETYYIWLLLAACAGAQLILPWTTDFPDTYLDIGPDGPWQAVIATINNTRIPLWPSGSGVTELLTADLNGTYTPSEVSNKTGKTRRNADTWMSSPFLHGGFSGTEYYDKLVVETKVSTGRELGVNATIIAADEWRSTGDGENAAPQVGLLGLGQQLSRGDDKTVGSMLEQLKAAGDIDRAAWSVHMGSAALDLAGSLVLGGYEQNRALGDVGTFALNQGIPSVFLRDVFMGTEAGAPSSFPASQNGSFWVEPTDQAVGVTKAYGGPEGSAVVIPNPVSPYIYLQPGVCEAIAGNLGLKYHNSTGLYLWESNRNGSVRDFINSPSYLGFVFSDKAATNLTIKVPFKLLHLTLQPPLVESEVNYFPCKSVNASGTGLWQLGRAFLQAAFFAVDYDGGVSYMAQGPGPGVEQSVIQKFDDKVIKTNPITTFSTSWSKFWAVTPLQEEGEDLRLNDKDNGMTTGGIAGIAVGSVAVLVAVSWLLRRLKKKRQGPEAPPDYVDKAVLWFNEKRGKSQRKHIASDTSSLEDSDNDEYAMEQKLKGGWGPKELDGGHLPSEMGGPHYEAKELDSREKPAEMGVPRDHAEELDSKVIPAEMETPVSSYTYARTPASSRSRRYESPNDSAVYELPASTYMYRMERRK